ncbi:vitamin K epoxide reductase family protein (plasmid) [Mesorhizobium atlanticum]
MHPEIKRSEPGSCPICGMTLVEAPAQGAAIPAIQSQTMTAMTSGMEGYAMPGMAAGGMGDMMGEAHRAMLWPHYVAMMLGFWMITAPFTLGYLSNFVPDVNQLRVMAERGLTPFAHRNMEMTISDVASGVLIVIFGYLSANAQRRYPWAQWANAVIGGWLLMAPLVFWTPLPEAYANGTLVGSVVIAVAVLIPMMPGMSMEGMMGKPDIPPEWGYNPASWLQRVPIAAFALLGFLIARYMTAYQLGHIDSQWDPFFAGENGLNGTETIITSSVSKAWPVADAGLGALVYALEIVMTFMGGKDRWRTMPWMVLALALLIVPLGVVSIYFVIIQPIVIGTLVHAVVWSQRWRWR